MTLIPFVILFIIAFTMDSKRIGKFIADLLRIFSMFYIVRSCCIWVTLLPGPAPHCRPGGSFRPPQEYFVFIICLIASWIDVIGHMPVDGISFTTCGDLVPSGHIGFVTIALVAILRELPRRFLSCSVRSEFECRSEELCSGMLPLRVDYRVFHHCHQEALHGGCGCGLFLILFLKISSIDNIMKLEISILDNCCVQCR